MNIYKQYLNVIKEIDVIGKDATNPFARSKYASLPNIIKKVQPILNERGLVFKVDIPELLQFKSEPVEETKTDKDGTVTRKIFQQTSGFYKVQARLIDVEQEGGEGGFMEWELTVPHDSTQRNPTQGFGSTATYIQRYAYGIVFQIPFDDQDPDASDKPGTNAASSTAESNSEDDKPWLNKGTTQYAEAVKYIEGGGKVSEIRKKYKVNKDIAKLLEEKSPKE